MEFLQQLFENSDIPIISAFILGLMTAISPCPLATNITATAYLSKDISDKRKVLLNSLLYTLGRAISYVGVGLLIYLGASKFDISTLFSTYGERLLGPLLIIIGLFMLGVIKLGKVTGVGVSQKLTDRISGKGYLSAVLMGMIFALAFCPYSGVLYFGMLIPMSVKDDGSLLNLLFFSIGTGLPVIIISIILAYGLAGVGNVFNKIKTFEKWFRKIVGLIFVLTGIYYIMIFMGWM